MYSKSKNWFINQGVEVTPFSYWKFNGNSLDLVGGNNGLDTDISYTQGKYGDCASFNGSTSFIEVPDSNNLSFTDGSNDLPFSISLWLNLDKTYNTGLALFLNKISASNREYEIRYANGYVYVYVYDNDASNFLSRRQNFEFGTGVWKHIVMTYDASSDINGLKLYVDAVNYSGATTVNGTYVRMRNSNAPLRFGKWYNGLHLEGKLDDVRFYNKVLTQKKITEIFNS